MSPRFTFRRSGTRAAAFSLIALVLGIPAVTMRLLCVGGSCETTAEASSFAPFCSLPDGIRTSITQSTRDGRSGELLMVTRTPALSGGTAFTGRSSLEPLWPSLDGDSHRVPIVMAGAGVSPRSLPPGTGLDDVAPTISEILDFERPHPEVRSGESISDVVDSSQNPRLVIVVAWKGIGSTTLEENPGSFPNLDRLTKRGSGTWDATSNSHSSDPAAPLTTLGTGGSPSEHGITGSLLRNERSELVGAWARRSPVNVIATLGEDLDKAFDQEPVIALVGADEIDKGLIGGGWYVENDSDLVAMLPRSSSPESITAEAAELLRLTPLAKDDVPDLLAIAQQGRLEELDDQLGRLWRAARDAAGDDFVMVVAGTGSGNGPAGEVAATRGVLRRLEAVVPGERKVIEGAGPGELFLDQEVLAQQKLSDEVILDALIDMRSRSGDPLFADVFPSVTVTFGRYC